MLKSYMICFSIWIRIISKVCENMRINFFSTFCQMFFVYSIQTLHIVGKLTSLWKQIKTKMYINRVERVVYKCFINIIMWLNYQNFFFFFVNAVIYFWKVYVRLMIASDFYYPIYFQLDILHIIHKNYVQICNTYMVIRVKSNIQE